MDHVRGLIVYECRARTGENLLRKDGRPKALAVARRMRISTPTVSRVLRGAREVRPGVEHPRRMHWEPSQELLDGLQRWLDCDIEELWARIRITPAEPPFPTLRRVPRRR